MRKKLLFIFNPKSGKAAIQKDLLSILEFYNSKGFLVTAYPTQCAGDARNFMSNLPEHYDLIVTAGGDGTMNEVACGMIESGQTQILSYIPMGSTNDFGASIGVHAGNLYRALDTSVNGRLMALDVGCLNERNFIYVAAFGLFTDVPYTTPQKLKNSLGYAAYVLQGVKALTELKAIHLILSHDDETIEGDFIVGLVTNSFQVSGFKNPVAQVTQLNDGLMECLFIKMPNNIFEMNGIITALLSGNVMENDHFVTIQTSHLHIRGADVSWTLDGEYGGTYDEMDISIDANRMPMHIYDDGHLANKLVLPDPEPDDDAAGGCV